MNNQGIPVQEHILTGQTERIASVNQAGSVRIVAKITAIATFFLLLAGSLVTGNKAALADPTWPQFVGHWTPQSFEGGLLFADGHRLFVTFVGFLTVLLAILIQFNDPRRFMKKLGWGAVALIIVQALFGGLIIKSIRNPGVSMIHASLAQVFFCVTVAMAFYSSRTWQHDLSRPTVFLPTNRGYLKFLKFAVAVVFIQVMMGTGVRHSNDVTDLFLPFLMAHISGAFAVICTIIWFNLRTWHVYSDVAPLRHASLGAAGLVIYQICFGILSIFTNRYRALPEIAHISDIVVSSMHLLGGASLLALMFATFLRARGLLDRGADACNSIHTYQSTEVKA